VQIEKVEGKSGLKWFKLQGATLSRILLEKVSFLILAFISFASNMIGAHNRMGLYGTGYVSLGLRISNAIVSIVKYLGKLFWPHNLSILYPYPIMIPQWQTLGSLLVLVVLTIFALRTAARHPYYIVGWFWFLGGLVPFLGIFMAGVWPEMADRYAYFTFIGIFAALAWGIPGIMERWTNSTPALTVLATGVMIAFAILTWMQVGYWKDSRTLFTHVLSVIDGKVGSFNNIGLSTAHVSLGLALYDQGDKQGAIKEYRKAILIDPFFDDAHFYLSIVLTDQGNIVEAAEQYLECMKLNPHRKGVHGRLGSLMMYMGYYNDAIKFYTEALYEDPNSAEIYYNLGFAYLRTGNVTKAIESYTHALMVSPNFSEASDALVKARIAKQSLDQLIQATRNDLQKEPGDPNLLARLGDIYQQQGDHENAILQYNKALSAISDRKDLIKVCYRLALAYSDMQEYSRATDALLSIKQLQPDTPDIYYKLACLSAKQNRSDEAVAWLKQAVKKGFNKWDLIRRDPDLANIRHTAFVNEMMKNH
jgi:tetratricopeptide (TPR) repeat protein